MAEKKRVIALGFFDGVHRGHGLLLKRTKERASELGAVPAVLSFDVHPDTLVFGSDVKLINSISDRKELIRSYYGIEEVLFLHFDRAMMGSTRVCKNVKIDNLVQVAHNVQVGASTFLCAQTGIAGSTTIGKHCILAGQVGVAGHIEVADGCVFGAQTGVAGNIHKTGMYQGSPAIDAMNWRKSAVGYKRLPDIMDRLNALEKQVNENK